ncbi:Retrovirus-related Pol polyprotein from transposon TNT 1-94 [Senna tora]|uniref:Retrovirus-related Pol polyprotein from transposon TNT 1-94 n=1 Tax=Senna tora TaxID=362788 RepID=A0A835CFI5_9FABA|nr:Retrovirus-related Pol polyprotein from transposon TNT 1-94 [Senna tora]
MASETSKFTLQSLPPPLATKLDDFNFLIWRLQVVTIVNGYDMYSYLFEEHVPKEFLTEEDKKSGKINSVFLNWKRQDQVLMSWILMSMSEGMVSRMVGCAHSYEVWQAIDTHFATQTKARESQLFTQFRSTKKGSLGMSEYLLKMKKVVDALASINSPVSEWDHIQTIFDGLPSEYEGFITSLSLKSKRFTVPQIEAHLLAQEARLEKSKIESGETISANVAQTSSKNSFQRGQSSSQNSQNSGNQRGGFQTRAPFRGRGRNRGGRQADTLRQTQIQNQNASNTNNSNTTPNQSVEALLANPETLYDASWYPDSGASSHLTNDASNLQVRQPYNGQELVHTANGTGLPIQSVGYSNISSSNSQILHLSQLYHVPSVSKNLISVSKFAKDNRVYFEFHANEFSIKSQETHQVLLKGRMLNGLYIFDSLPLIHKGSSTRNESTHFASAEQPKSSSSNMNQIWHNRLGHPGSNILNNVLNTCNMNISSNNKDFFCDSCCLEKQLNTTLKAVQTDFGGEFRPFTTYLQENGIVHRLSCPHTHQQSGTAERKHRHVTETGLTLLATASLPLKYWDEAFITSVFLINRLPTPRLSNKTPYEKDNINSHDKSGTVTTISATQNIQVTTPVDQRHITPTVAPVSLPLEPPTASTFLDPAGSPINTQSSRSNSEGNANTNSNSCQTSSSQNTDVPQLEPANSTSGQTNSVSPIPEQDLANSKPQKTPMVSGLKLSSQGTDVCPDPHAYRSLVGALQYVTLTRPEISYCVNKLCQFMHNPLLSHLQAAKRVLRYLKGTITHGDVFYVKWDEVLVGATAVVSTLGGFGSEEQMKRINGEANVVAVNAAKEYCEESFAIILRLKSPMRSI